MSRVSLEPELEKRLVEESKKDPKHFASLYTHYYPHIRRYVQRRVSEDISVIEDITEKVFEKALRNINKFKWQGYSFSSWLYRIAGNTITDYFRENNDKHSKHTELIEDSVASMSLDTPEHVFETEYADELLGNMISKLPSREREIVSLKFFSGYSNKVIADRLGISESNVGTIVHRCVQRMREYFQNM
jgi:RNA polymerase sigma-70 factor (ECF subfamily)